ncbi:MAG: polyhydroxyalkanoic acid system family protein [Halieaceae bacterium]
MAGFSVSRSYTMSKDDVREAAEELAREMKTQYGLSYRWNGDRATFRGSGVDGSLNIEDDTISVKVKLGLMAMAFEGSLRRAVNQYLDEHVS